ncbi:hypothetical protein F5883DRAFT_653478 [Diaporthe sp. PMI_573]|nr:hypothetical protein F5883DRAFT_653478 [Diaporthaceae sp. PMI_573]
MESMQKKEPSATEKTATDHIVPDTDRGLEDSGYTSIKELLNSLTGDSSDEPRPSREPTAPPKQRQPSSGTERSAPAPGDAHADLEADTIYENVSSAMFPVDRSAAFKDANKLFFLVDAIQMTEDQDPKQTRGHRINLHTAGNQPFIRVEHGAEFADNLHADFFPQTFPTLFP